MTIKTNVKAAGICCMYGNPNHNQTAGLRVKSNVKAAGICCMYGNPNHNQTAA